MNKRRSNLSFYLIIIIIIGVTIFISDFSRNLRSGYEYYNFQQDIEAGNVEKVIIKPNQETPTGEISVQLKNGEKEQFYYTDVNEVADYAYEHGLGDKVVTQDVDRPSILFTILPYILGFGVILLLFNMMAAQSGGGNNKMMNFGKSRAKMTTGGQTNVTFENVAGLQEEKEELKEVVDFLRSPGKYMNVGARIPKGVLLVGPPDRKSVV